MGSRPKTRIVVGAIVVALLAYGAWLAHGDHEYRNTIVWFGGYAGVAGFVVACCLASTRRRFLGVLVAGAVGLAAVIGGLLLQAYADDTLTLRSAVGFALVVFGYLANLVGWAVGAKLGSRMRTGGTGPPSPRSKAA